METGRKSAIFSKNFILLNNTLGNWPECSNETFYFLLFLFYIVIVVVMSVHIYNLISVITHCSTENDGKVMFIFVYYK